LVETKGIAPHIPVLDKSKRDDGTFSRSDFRYDPTSDVEAKTSLLGRALYRMGKGLSGRLISSQGMGWYQR
jgi:hypothetical protein